MSRLGKTPIQIPKGTEINISKENHLTFKGSKGSLEMELPPQYKLKVEEGFAILEFTATKPEKTSFYGLYRSLIKNNIIGVSEGYEVKLTMIGVGYRAAVQGAKLDLQVGNSHPTFLEIPKDLQVVVEKGTSISVKGIDKRKVGQFAAMIRAEKRPEPYKGKGIRYENEYVPKKEGKAAKGKA